jgi:hypothetical protein
VSVLHEALAYLGIATVLASLRPAGGRVRLRPSLGVLAVDSAAAAGLLGLRAATTSGSRISRSVGVQSRTAACQPESRAELWNPKEYANNSWTGLLITCRV